MDHGKEKPGRKHYSFQCSHSDTHTTTSLPLSALLSVLPRFLVVPSQRTLTQGARVHFTGDRSLTVVLENRASALQHSEVVSESFRVETAAARFLGPFSPEQVPFPAFRISPVGVIPKSGTPDYRLIVDFTYPEEKGVNQHIEDRFPMKFNAFDQTLHFIHSSGPGTWLSKSDVANAFRNIPIHPEDVPLLGMQWEGKVFFDRFLPFGLRSSPSIWERFATTLQWLILEHVRPPLTVHHVDDFLNAWGPDTSEDAANQQLDDILRLCLYLGVPIKAVKTVRPTTLMLFLGWLINTLDMTISIPDDKLKRALARLNKFKRRARCSLRGLQKLAGVLHHLSYVIRQGRPFLGRIYSAQAAFHREPFPHHIPVTAELRADCNWWIRLLRATKGRSLVAAIGADAPGLPDVEVFTDACGSGFGAVNGDAWISGKWSQEDIAAATRTSSISSSHLEAQAVIRALHTWAPDFTGKRVLFHCDNSGVVAAWSSGLASEPQLRELVREMMLITATCGFELTMVHVAGSENQAADALSRDDLQGFRSALPSAEAFARPVPPSLPIASLPL